VTGLRAAWLCAADNRLQPVLFCPARRAGDVSGSMTDWMCPHTHGGTRRHGSAREGSSISGLG
jgi:hypothetical protein